MKKDFEATLTPEERKGKEEFGNLRLERALQKWGASAQSILADVQQFAHRGILADDATAVVLRH